MRVNHLAKVALVALVLVGSAAILPIQAHHKQGHSGGQDKSDWPPGAEGPFPLKEVLTDPITSFDGTQLETTIYVPDLSGLPKHVKPPVVLWSNPYLGSCALGNCRPPSDSECVYEGCDPVRDINVTNLVRHGFAVAIVNVRGTGNSEGCFSFGGLAEQQDQVHVVEDLAARSWSNGRVAMYGASYHGFTPWMAAINAPQGLKTIVPSSIVTNLYTFYHTPQGAPIELLGVTGAALVATTTYVPPHNGPMERATSDYAEHLPDRICPEAMQAMTEGAVSGFTGLRDSSFWEERRLDQHFQNITVPVLVSHGLNDVGGGTYQEDIVWDALPSDLPKRFILGQWRHVVAPPSDFLEEAPFGTDWERDVLFPWLDYYLKGIGDPDALHLGEVAYQRHGDLAWRTTTSWPPADVAEEVLYLTPQGLAGKAAEGSFTVTPGLAFQRTCPTAGTTTNPVMPVFVTPPLTEPVTVAGNPMAYLTLSSTAPRGHLAVDLWVGRGECPEDQGWLTGGVASLGFHAGGYEAQEFPVGTPTPVRIDLNAEAVHLQEGERLMLTLSGNGAFAHVGEPVFPVITVHGGTTATASHIVLPLVEGTLGGESPTLTYPPRPFMPGTS